MILSAESLVNLAAAYESAMCDLTGEAADSFKPSLKSLAAMASAVALIPVPTKADILEAINEAEVTWFDAGPDKRTRQDFVSDAILAKIGGGDVV